MIGWCSKHAMFLSDNVNKREKCILEIISRAYATENNEIRYNECVRTYVGLQGLLYLFAATVTWRRL